MSKALDVREAGLTEEDIRFIDQIASFMIEAGIWERLAYHTSENAEFIEAYQADYSEPVFGMGRHRRGLYVMSDYRAGVIMIGSTLIQALEQHARINSDYAPLLPN